MGETDLSWRTWLRVWTGVAALAAGFAPLVLPVSAVVFLALMGLAAGASTAAGLLPHEAVASREGHRRRWGAVLQGGLRAAAWVVGAMTVACFNAYLALLVLMAVALSSPWVLHHVRRRPAESNLRSDLALEPRRERSLFEGAAATVGRLDIDGLCWAWRRSYLALGDVRAPQARLGLVILRQLYLDEMERRDPKGFQAWLDSGAQAAGAPDRFLNGDRTGEQDAA